ncbi:putative purine phosphoribosyltransferase [Corynebacterium renale]|uniref:phosphoribosyltransferase n=1 Tax=Corynebacterium renale TaxID=1724 RepID=UPI000DA29069|nr:phosphoribosyltransferase family protein [Corynebacterium renale]SQG64664.1 putative purine phosphoribosyltransferase [Corynebacterium renale]STC95852.1 putative purine phosphoribosyltransferase [Corynebacterium renale]
MDEPRENLTYETFGTAVRELAADILEDYQPDLILSIARGGLLIGGALGYAMDIKNVSVINVEFYTGVDERLEQPVMLPPTPKAVDLSGMKVLIADDVADTGETLKLVQDYCAETVAESRTAVIYAKSRSIIQPDYVWKKTDQWINFPWSVLPPVNAEIEKP